MAIKVISHLDTLKMASGSQTIMEMIEKITTDGSLNKEYEYLYSNLFVIFNRIYNNGLGLDVSINNSLMSNINGSFSSMHYHISVAEGLAAGIITSPGVGPEVDEAKDASNDVKNGIKTLSDSPSQILNSAETKGYVNALQKATEDKALNVNELIKRLFWTIIINLGKVNATQADFEGKIAEIHLELLKLKTAGWKGYFALENLKINLIKPGQNDDLDKVQSTLSTMGEIVGVLGLVAMVYNWKASGVMPGGFLKSILEKFTSSTPEEAAEMSATSLGIEEEVVEISTMEAFADVLGVVGLLLAVIGGIYEAVKLDQELDKIDDAKNKFNSSYNQLVANLQSVSRASEGIRKHSK